MQALLSQCTAEESEGNRLRGGGGLTLLDSHPVLLIPSTTVRAETQGRPETLIPSATAWGTDIHTNTHTLAQSKHRSSNFASILIGHSALNCVAQAILLRFLIIAALLAKRNASPTEQNKLHTR